jgi:signal peptidase I
MSKRTSGTKPLTAPESTSATPQGDGSHRRLPSPGATRETIESLAIALVLAFLFRAFEAEAFVIPTGSMAPTLMGRHKDLTCPMCGCPYQLSASEEVDSDGVSRTRDDAAIRVSAGTCPMCRYTADLHKDFPRTGYPRSYNGDRILVDKLAYVFDDPKRWDVVVFHYPNDATTNYIKRLVGLPGETVRIQHGDIWTRRENEEFRIARKRPEKLLAMLQPVFDNDYMPAIARYGWPQRWTPDPAGGAGAWQSDGDAAFAIDGHGRGEQWLRYHHRIPLADEWNAHAYGQWKMISEQQSRDPQPMVPDQLVKDFTAFDTSRTGGAPAGTVGSHWVGDLVVECAAEIRSETGALMFELRKGTRRFQCHVDVGTGRATLSISGRGMQQFRPSAQTTLHGEGRHDIRFSNCDHELLLWVDGSVVSFDAKTTYPDLGDTEYDELAPGNLTPVGIASVGAAARVSHLRILRDIYYIAVEGDAPHRWIRPEQASVDFPLKADQFFMLGDNSANSQDSRLWGNDHWVDRNLLIGKAMFIYWPHSWHYVPYIDVPFWPYFARMGMVK